MPNETCQHPDCACPAIATCICPDDHTHFLPVVTRRARLHAWWRRQWPLRWYHRTRALLFALRMLPSTTAAVAAHSQQFAHVKQAFGNHATTLTNHGEITIDMLARLAAIEELLKHTGAKRAAILKRLYERARDEYQLRKQQPPPEPAPTLADGEVRDAVAPLAVAPR